MIMGDYAPNSNTNNTNNTNNSKKLKIKPTMEEHVNNFRNFILGAGFDEKLHQIDGIKWILNNELRTEAPCDVHGGLIADEMGLGKTIQMLGAIICNPKRHTLIVLPLALLDQWDKAIQKTMHHKSLIYHGPNKKTISIEDLKSCPIVITTYGLISATRDGKKKSLLHEIKWNRIIFDEAHHMRNKNTRIHKGALKLKGNIRWLVTGTPIQNAKEDFFNLCAVMGLKNKYYTNLKNLKELVRNFIMKRTKKDAKIDLPELKLTPNIIPWKNAEEQNLAEDIHSMLQFSMVTKGQVNNMVNYLANGHLAMLVRARQACVYPKLMENHIKHLMKQGVIENKQEFLDACNQSSKIDAIIKLICERKTNQRGKLVFCHYRGEIDIIADRLKSEELNVETFDGRTSNTDRNEILTNPDLDVLILQIQTGCEGLNLQHFSEIYFASPHWNPAVEDQAIARCHRIGQESEVDVFRFEMGSFEDNEETRTLDTHSANVQNAKRHIAGILDKPESIPESL